METKPHRYIEDRITDLEDQVRDLKCGAEIRATEEQRHREEIRNLFEVKFQSVVAILETKASQEELSSLVDVVAGKASHDHVGRVHSALGEQRAEAERQRAEFQGQMAEAAGNQQARHAEALSLLDSHRGELDSRHTEVLVLLDSHRGELESRICGTAAEQSRELESRWGDHSATLDDHRSDFDVRMGEHGSELEAHRSELQGRICETAAELDARMGEHGAKLEAHRSELQGRICEAAEEQQRLADILAELQASRQELFTAVATKASEERLQAVSTELTSKATIQDVQDLLSHLEGKVSNAAFRELSAMMASKASSHEFQDLHASIESKVSNAALHELTSRFATSEQFRDLAVMTGEQLEELAGAMDDKASRQNLEFFQTSLKRKVSNEEVQSLVAELDLKADKTFVRESLELKADKTFVRESSDPKADRTWVEERISKISEFKQVRSRSRSLLFRNDDKPDDWHRDL